MAIPDKRWQPPYVTIETTMGEFVVECYWKHAPQTCRNFAELARRGKLIFQFIRQNINFREIPTPIYVTYKIINNAIIPKVNQK